MKDFLQKHVTLLSGLVVGSFIAIFILLVLLITTNELQQRARTENDISEVDIAHLPGPKEQISDRSKKEIAVLFEGNPNVAGIYVTKIHYGKTENPIFFYISNDPYFEKAIMKYDAIQKSGEGQSSEELNEASEQSLRNSEEAKTGLIKCDTIFSTNIPKLSPGIENVAKGVCRATIPPFDPKVNLAIVVLLKPDGRTPSEEIQEIRRVLLQLQIDIYNRDFKGRETWAHP